MDYIKCETFENQLTGDKVGIRGRIILKRNLGKRVFCTVRDDSGTIQVSLSRNDFQTDDEFKEVKKKLKVGNIISVGGEVMQTEKGAHALKTCNLEVLSECRKVLPDKDKGVSSQIQYRNRGLHLLSDGEAISRFRMLNGMRYSIRDYLHEQNFEEVDTGILKQVSDTSMSAEFVTKGKWNNKPLFLRKSTEMRLKQLMVGGLERIFELGKEFRNEGVSSLFLPEFTALELYAAYTDYRDILDLTVGMMKRIEEDTEEPESQPTRFKDIYFYDFIESETGVDLRDASDNIIRNLIDDDIRKDYGDHPAMRSFYMYDVFRTLLRRYPNENLVLHGVPMEVSPLAKTFDNEPSLVEEFRYFVRGTSFCGGMTELTDPEEQRRRILNQSQYLGKTLDSNDDKFIEMLEYGLHPCGGLGLSLERLMMIYSERPNIKDVVYFPL